MSVNSKMTALANAIRTKSGVTGLLGLDAMTSAVLSIEKKTETTKSITPTLTDAEPGDLRYALPANVLDSIIQTLDNMSNVIPNLNGPNTILYAPEVKFYSSLIDVNEKLQVEEYPDIYWLGDSSGITHGIMQSSISGLYSSDLILEKNRNIF